MAKECVQQTTQPRFSRDQTERRRFLTPRRSTSRKREKEYESDPHRLAQRQRQIMYGENTPGYRNFIRLLETDPSLLQGCIPLKPSIVQKCSKRSWDGQVRKWRRALHMYDFVDFGEDETESVKVRDALVEQTKNPLFVTPKKVPVGNGQEVVVTAIPKNLPPLAGGDVRLPVDFDVERCERVRYSFDDLLRLAESPLIATSIKLPDTLMWLDKRVDLEDDVEDEVVEVLASTPHKSSFSPNYSRSSPSSSTPGPSPTPTRFSGPSASIRSFPNSPATPGVGGLFVGDLLRTPPRGDRVVAQPPPVPAVPVAPKQASPPFAAPQFPASVVAPVSPLDFLQQHAVQEVRTVKPVVHHPVPLVPQLFPAGELHGPTMIPQVFHTPTRAQPLVPAGPCVIRPVVIPQAAY